MFYTMHNFKKIITL